MLDELIGGLKNQVAGQLKTEDGVSDIQVDGIMDVVKNVAGEKIGGELLGGNTDSVMNLFSEKTNTPQANSLQSGLESGIADGLMEKLGIDSEQASSIVSKLAPVLIGLFTEKNNETPEGDASSLTDLLGGSGGGLGNLAKKALGGLFGK